MVASHGIPQDLADDRLSSLARQQNIALYFPRRVAVGHHEVLVGGRWVQRLFKRCGLLRVDALKDLDNLVGQFRRAFSRTRVEDPADEQDRARLLLTDEEKERPIDADLVVGRLGRTRTGH